MRKVTSLDVAKAAGVSQTTVSFILNGSDKVKFSDETKERVFAAATELGYTIPAQRSRKKQAGKSKLICVLTPTLSNYYFTELIQYAQNYANSKGYHIVVCNTFREKEMEKYYLEYFKNADGILYTFSPSFPHVVERIADKVPTVIISGQSSETDLFSIELANHDAGARVAEYLYSLGHRKFVFVSTPLKRFSPSREQRLEGITKVLEGYGLKDAVQVLAMEGNSERENPDMNISYEFEAGRSMVLDALRHGLGGATALICVNDMTAFGVLDALKTCGISVPGEISVCGFDNLMPSLLTAPPLTTVDNQLQKCCETAIEYLIAQAQGKAGEKPAAQAAYAPRLMVRGSTGPAAGGL